MRKVPTLMHGAVLAGLKEFHNAPDNGSAIFGVAAWMGQTFTPVVGHTLANVRAKLSKAVGSTVGTLTIAIRATSGGLPTGADIVSVSFDGNTLSETPVTNWFRVFMSTVLSVGVLYAIIIYAPASDASAVIWRLDAAAGYTVGESVSSANSGVTWTTVGSDQMFEEYS